MRRAAWGAGYLYVAGLVLFIQVRFTGLNFLPAGSLRAFLEGTAPHPWAGRVLMPTLVKLFMMLIPAPVQEWVLGVYSTNGPFTDVAAYPAEASFAKLVFALLALVCFAGTGYLLRALIRHYYGWSEPAASAAGLLGMLLIPSMFRYTTYIYDPPTIMLSCLLAWALACRNDPLLLAGFALACLNKETAIVFVPVSVLFRWRERPRAHSVVVGLGLVIIWGTVRGVIAWALADRAGAVLGVYLVQHNAELFRDYWPGLLCFMLYTGCLVGLVHRDWQEKPREVRLGLLLTLLPLAAATVPFGYVDEVRDWYDAYPYLFLAVAPTLWQVLGIGGGREAAGDLEKRDTATVVPSRGAGPFTQGKLFSRNYTSFG